MGEHERPEYAAVQLRGLTGKTTCFTTGFDFTRCNRRLLVTKLNLRVGLLRRRIGKVYRVTTFDIFISAFFFAFRVFSRPVAISSASSDWPNNSAIFSVDGLG
jgi:hypothetical protein